MYLGMAARDPGASTPQLGSFPRTGKRLPACSPGVSVAREGRQPQPRQGWAILRRAAAQRLRSCQHSGPGRTGAASAGTWRHSRVLPSCSWEVRGCSLQVRGKRKNSFKQVFCLCVLPQRTGSQSVRNWNVSVQEQPAGYFRDLPFPLPQVFFPEGGKAHKGHDSCFLTSSCGDVFQMFPLTECGFATNHIPVSLRSSPPPPTAAL